MEIINENQTIQSTISSHFLKLVTKIFLPFSLVSVILSYPLLCNFRTLSYSLHLFSFSVGKNYMFLLCIGLLFFIATSSALFGGFGVESDIKSDKTPRIGKRGGQREIGVESSEPRESILKAKVTAEVDQREEDLPLVVQDEEEEEEISNELVPGVDDEELGLLSDEELNKKCEDFIRRMKEGFNSKLAIDGSIVD